MSHPEILDVVQRALEEDIGSGDITSQLCVPAHLEATGKFIARESLVIAGLDLLPLIYEQRGAEDAVELLRRDGERIEPNEVVAVVTGKARTLLECERVALNFLQRLSGVATLARAFVDGVSETDCRILDTRKTTPGLRRLEKMAACAGGVKNHRMGLYDAVLIKNNHITAAGGVKKAIENVRLGAPDMPLEVEVRTREELMEALGAGATHLLIDNLSSEEAADWVRTVAGRAVIEISGGVTLENVLFYARTGATYVSAGALTHSARAMDLSFRLQRDPLFPNVNIVKTEAYPLSRRPYFYVPDDTKREAREFTRFTISDAGQAIVEKNGFIGQKVSIMTDEKTPANAATGYQRIISSADRLRLPVK